MPKVEAVIKELVEVAPETRLFRLTLQDTIPFIPGQHAMLFKPAEKHFVGRPYSMCSLPQDEPFMEFIIKKYPEGKVTTYLFDRVVGDTLLVSQAFGRLTLKNRQKPLVFLATGTGIAPVVSICKDILKHNFPYKIHVLFGARTEADIYYNELFRQWEKDNGLFYFVPCLSNASSSWHGRKGWVQDNLDAIPNWIENDYYIVGLHPMVDACKQRLVNAGVPVEQIFTETE